MSICLAFSDVDWTLTKDIFSVIGTIVSGCGVVAAIVFGKIGLSTWRRQAKGANDHELSRRILLGVYRYREAINRTRYPSFKKHEMKAVPESERYLDYDVARFRRLANMYEKRLEEVVACRSELNVDLVEGNAMWNRGLTPLFEDIDDMEFQLFQYVSTYLYSINPEVPKATRDACQITLSKLPDILYDDLSKEGDEFRKKMSAKIGNIQSFLVSKMIR